MDCKPKSAARARGAILLGFIMYSMFGVSAVTRAADPTGLSSASASTAWGATGSS